ncbi:MAG: tRNA (adenosine(37)-N6)-dimethylallyltransferase MiaA [Bacteroidota bacterium]
MPGAAPRVMVVVGPTASGKSALALELAARLPVEIVCCDSQQVYVGMDIGTGKPTAADRAAVRHHLLDVVSPTETFQAARWAALARAAIGEIVARERVPVIVGGTGLYLRALLVGLFEAPPPDAAIRQRHRDEAERAGVPALHARLTAIDPETAARVQPQDLLRISRALEVQEQTGLSMSALRRTQAAPPAIHAETLVLDPALPALRERIAARFDDMMAAGFLDEVSGLRNRFGSDARALQALGYRQLGEHLDGRLTLDEAIIASKSATAAYARRQRTWFRQDAQAWRADATPDPAQVVAWWSRGATGT